MTPKEFYLAVVDMRLAQKTYFKTRTQADLKYCKVLEAKIDHEIDRVRGITNRGNEVSYEYTE